jgi:hypothetical protein
LGQSKLKNCACIVAFSKKKVQFFTNWKNICNFATQM